ncbi:MAG: glycosyltransferase [Clostridia bacterium]|nr:glycosyltransferase [Clostridia bacterium]
MRKISVIVPIYNMDKYLSRCIDSILAQTYANLQIILVNDGSTDSSPQLCDQYADEDDRIVVVHKSNGGLSSARNAGIDVAIGDYVGFVDSDDYIAPDMYEQLIQRMGSSDAEISNVMYVRVDEKAVESPSKVPHFRDEEISSPDFAKELMLHLGDVSVCTKLFSRALFKDVRFCENKLNEDLLFILELLSKIKVIHFVGKVGYYYFSRSGSISNGYGKAVEDMVENSVVAMELVKGQFPHLAEAAERFALYQHMAYLLLLPQELAKKGNAIYLNAVRFVRKNFLKNIGNRYLSPKNKLVLFLQIFLPRTTGRIFRTLKN